MKRSHMNFCVDCRNAFEIINSIDYCEDCRIALGIAPGEYQDNETQPEIVEQIKEAYLNYGVVIS